MCKGLISKLFGGGKAAASIPAAAAISDRAEKVATVKKGEGAATEPAGQNSSISVGTKAKRKGVPGLYI